MKYKTYNCNSFNIYTIKTDRFKTSHLEVIFKNVLKKEEIGTYSFLADMLSEGCKKYPRKKDLITRFEELYKIVIYASTVRVGNVLDLHVSLDFINPEYIEEDNYVEEVIKTLFEMIERPNVENDEFDLKTFNIIKEYTSGEIPLYHMDVYRLEDTDETIGFNDYFNKGGVTIIEWADIIKDKLPEKRLDIKFKFIDEDTRVLVLIPHGEEYEEICNAVL